MNMTNEERVLLGLPMLYRVTSCCEPGFDPSTHSCADIVGKIVKRDSAPVSIRTFDKKYGSIQVIDMEGRRTTVWSIKDYDGPIERIDE